MTEKQAGLTAMVMAYSRAYHATHESPKIFDDFLADALFTPEDHAKTDRDWASMLPYIAPELSAANPSPEMALAWVVQLTNGPITLGRSRYTEDSLAEALQKAPVRQYVILGAGFDTFAYRAAIRRPELADRLQIFVLDHPATQAIMRQRAAAAGWRDPANLHYVPIDFTQESITDALGRTAYDPKGLSFFSWLGVSYYLTREVVFDTLRSLASIATPGSTIVFDYLDLDAYHPEKAGKLIQQMQWMAVQLGEPMKAGFDPDALAADLDRLGLCLEENLNPAAIDSRYYQGRSDRYRAVEHFHYARAGVKSTMPRAG